MSKTWQKKETCKLSTSNFKCVFDVFKRVRCCPSMFIQTFRCVERSTLLLFYLFFLSFHSFCFHSGEIFFAAFLVQFYLVWGFSSLVAFNCFNLKCLPPRIWEHFTRKAVVSTKIKVRNEVCQLQRTRTEQNGERDRKKRVTNNIHNILFMAEKKRWRKTKSNPTRTPSNVERNRKKESYGEGYNNNRHTHTNSEKNLKIQHEIFEIELKMKNKK